MNLSLKPQTRETITISEHKEDERRGPSNISRSLVGAPKCRTVLKYAFDQGVHSTSVLAHHFVWIANDAYNPASAVTPRQPLGFLEYATFYRRYRVHRVKLEVTGTAMNSTTAPWTSYQMVIYPSPTIDTSVTTQSLQSALERPMAQYKTLTQANSAGAARRHDTRYKSTWAITGGKSNDEDYAAYTEPTVGATQPTKIWYWNVLLYAMDNADSTLTPGFNARVTGVLHMDIEFYDRQVLAPF